MLPEKVKIGWKNYVVEQKEAVLVENNGCYGCIDYDETIICLRKENSPEQNEATLLHEIIHGVSEMYSLAFDEAVVTRLADALYTVARDNGFKLFEGEVKKE